MVSNRELSLEDVTRLKDILDSVNQAQEELDRAAEALRVERKRASELAAAGRPATISTPSETGKIVTAPIEGQPRGPDGQPTSEKAQLLQRIERLESQLKEAQRREQDLDQRRNRAVHSLRRGLTETLQALGSEDPWSVNEDLRRQNDTARRRISDLDSELHVAGAKLAGAEQQLRGMEGSRQAQRDEYERMRHEVTALPERVRGDLLARLLNQLGLTQMAEVLLAAEEGSMPETETARQLIDRLAVFLRNEGVAVSDRSGQSVRLVDEASLARYRIPEDERYRPGIARVTRPGIAYQDQVIIKASVRYIEEQEGERRTDEPVDYERGTSADGELPAAEPTADRDLRGNTPANANSASELPGFDGPSDGAPGESEADSGKSRSGHRKPAA